MDWNSFVIIFDELSNVFFRFSLRPIGAEIDGGGGGVRTPPSRWWKIGVPVGRGAFQHIYLTCELNPRPDRGVGAPPPLRFFADSEKTAARSAPGFEVPYGANLAQLMVKKWPGQIRSRSYDVIRGTTSGNFTNKSVFYRTLTWPHCLCCLCLCLFVISPTERLHLKAKSTVNTYRTC